MFSGIGAWAQQKPVLGTIIIDPGHGGKDPGAQWSVLDRGSRWPCLFPLNWEKALASELPDSKLIFTRTTDELPAAPNSIHDALDATGPIWPMQSRVICLLPFTVMLPAQGPVAGTPNGWLGIKTSTRVCGKEDQKDVKKQSVSPSTKAYWQKE